MQAEKIFFYEGLKGLNINFDTIEEVAHHIMDEKSKDIFYSRMLLSLTRDYRFIKNLVLSSQEGVQFYHDIEKHGIYLYGAGTRSEKIYKMFPDYRWRGIVDKYKRGTFEMFVIQNIQDVQLEQDDIVVITNQHYSQEIESELLNSGISKEQIVILNDYESRLLEKQYFEINANYSDIGDGVIVDGGSLDCGDAIKFIHSSYYRDNEIFSFEPDATNYQLCIERAQKYPMIKVLNAGLSDEHQNACMVKGGEGAHIDISGEGSVELETLDHLFSDKKVSLVKLDIEGYELKALKGGENIIKRDKPLLIISVYHKIEDIFEIPKYLLGINPNYYFEFKSYRIAGAADTVLYAYNRE